MYTCKYVTSYLITLLFFITKFTVKVNNDIISYDNALPRFKVPYSI